MLLQPPHKEQLESHEDESMDDSDGEEKQVAATAENDENVVEGVGEASGEADASVEALSEEFKTYMKLMEDDGAFDG